MMKVAAALTFAACVMTVTMGDNSSKELQEDAMGEGFNDESQQFSMNYSIGNDPNGEPEQNHQQHSTNSSIEDEPTDEPEQNHPQGYGRRRDETGPRQNPCPIQRFKDKHVCEECQNEDDAMRHALRRNQDRTLGGPCHMNTVIFGKVLKRDF